MKIVFINLYFGDLPDHFNYFLRSCEDNINIDWIIYTNDISFQKHRLPKNVFINLVTFEWLKKKIQNKLGFLVGLESYYKLCDFKPALGYIFSEDISCYDYWGYCDLDIIVGDMSKYITKNLIQNFEKIFTFGHLTLLRNTKEVNERFMLPFRMEKYELNYKDIFSLPFNCWFDEYCMDLIYNQYNLEYYSTYQHVADLDYRYTDFRLIFNQELSENNLIILWEHGHLYTVYLKDDQICKTEFGYCHFQKRNISVDKYTEISVNSFIITPKTFLNEYKPITSSNLIKYRSSVEDRGYGASHVKNLDDLKKKALYGLFHYMRSK